MSTAAVFPTSTSKPSLDREWVRAHVIAQVIGLAAAAASYGLVLAIGAHDPAPDLSLKTVALLALAGAELVTALSAAYLRGAVIRQILPDLPLRLWIVVVAAALMVVPLAGAFTVAGANEPLKALPMLAAHVVRAGVGFTLIASWCLGLAIGSVEALMLRQAATGVGPWIKWTGFAWAAAAMVTVAGGIVTQFNPGLSILTLALLGAAMRITQAVIVANVTFLGFAWLAPRHQADLKPPIAV